MRIPSVYIVEDEVIVSEELSEFLKIVGYHVVNIESDPNRAIAEILTQKPDLLLVDVNLNQPIDGIELVFEVQKHYQPAVIFLTAYNDKITVNRAKQAHPAAYLLKPFNLNSIEVAVDLALFNSQNHKSQSVKHENPFLFLKINGKYQKILIDDLLYIQADGSYCKLFLMNETILLSQSMADFYRKLNFGNLIQIHRKYIANINHVNAFDASNVYIQDVILPIGDAYKDKIFESLK